MHLFSSCHWGKKIPEFMTLRPRPLEICPNYFFRPTLFFSLENPVSLFDPFQQIWLFVYFAAMYVSGIHCVIGVLMDALSQRPLVQHLSEVGQWLKQCRSSAGLPVMGSNPSRCWTTFVGILISFHTIF